MEKKERNNLIDDVSSEVVKQLLRKRKFKKMIGDLIKDAVDKAVKKRLGPVEGDTSEA